MELNEMIFDNVTILTLNLVREIITHGAVVVKGQASAEVGKRRDVVDKYPVWRRIDDRGNILLPGLIDTHVHLGQCMLRGMDLTIHLAERDTDRVYAESQGYRSHVEFAQGHGLLGPHTVLAHCGASDAEDWKLLAAAGTRVAHCSANNAAAG